MDGEWTESEKPEGNWTGANVRHSVHGPKKMGKALRTLFAEPLANSMGTLPTLTHSLII
jgi:hypothetical protein